MRKANWIEKLKRLGVRAAQRDGEWVDWEEKVLFFAHLDFCESTEVGDKIAIGVPQNYRLVELTRHSETDYGVDKYNFKLLQGGNVAGIGPGRKNELAALAALIHIVPG